MKIGDVVGKLTVFLFSHPFDVMVCRGFNV
jgi:hypothetical protein